ncbi:MAG TPA: SMI1/KNR4 family protein [Candidatus Hydrogenedentes bacterium]|nr:SMI1/KNR4 family protein [Candidatus Hydrogenedentota bacterium]
MRELDAFVAQQKGAVHIVGGVQENDVAHAEKTLGTLLAPELKRYLSQYGCLAYRYLEFYGLGVPKSSHINMTSRTIDLRKEGLPLQYVAIADLDDGHYAICDTSGMVYEWAPANCDAVFNSLGCSFESYMLDCLRSASTE